MLSLETISKFVQTSGLRKISVSIYFFTGLSYLRAVDKLTVPAYGELVFYLILAVFAANGLEHYLKTHGRKGDVSSPITKAGA